MAKYHQKGQGTLSSIMGLVMFFLAIDLIIAALMVFNVKIQDLFNPKNTDNTPTVTTVVTDNTGITDNN